MLWLQQTLHPTSAAILTRHWLNSPQVYHLSLLCRPQSFPEWEGVGGKVEKGSRLAPIAVTRYQPTRHWPDSPSSYSIHKYQLGLLGWTTFRVAGVPLSQLFLTLDSNPAPPRHPLTYASRSQFYDSKWKEKQERALACWANYIFTPDEFKCDVGEFV